MFPGNREKKGILAYKMINIPIQIRMQPVINKGVSIFIIKYIVEDEVVNGNVPRHPIFHRSEYREKNIEICCNLNVFVTWRLFFFIR